MSDHDPFRKPDFAGGGEAPEYNYIKLAGRRSPGLLRWPNGPPARELGWDKQSGKGTSGANLVHTEVPPVEFEIELVLNSSLHMDQWEAWRSILDTPKEVITTITNPMPQAAVDDFAMQRARANKLPPPDDSAARARANLLPPAERKSRLAELDAQLAASGSKDKQSRINELDAQVKAKQKSLTSQKKELKALGISHPYLNEIGCRSVVVRSWSPPARVHGGPAIARIKFLEARTLVTTGSGTVNGSVGEGGGNPRTGGVVIPRCIQDRLDKIAERGKETGFL